MQYRISLTPQYLEVVTKLYEQLLESDKLELFSMPFIIFSGTFLEYMLNELLIEHANETFGQEIGKVHAESLISLSFPAKLVLTLPVITANKYCMNFDSKEYKNLKDLLIQRNRIAHGKDFYSNIPPETEMKSFVTIINQKQSDFKQKYSFRKCKDYKTGIDLFYRDIYLAYGNKEIKKGSMVGNISKMEKPNIKITYK